MHQTDVEVLKNKVNKSLEKAKAVSDYVFDITDNIQELEISQKVLNFRPNFLSPQMWKTLTELVDENVEELHEKIKEFYAIKQLNSLGALGSTVDDDERFEEESDLDKGLEQLRSDIENMECSLEGLESVLPDLEKWSEKLIDKTRKEVAAANAKKELARKNNKKGAKVKRVPEKGFFDAADVAAELGMEDLAKDLTIEYPKPFVTTKKEGPVTVREYFAETTDEVKGSELKELLEKAFNEQRSKPEDADKLKAVLEYESKKKPATFSMVPQNEAVSAFYSNETETETSLNTVERLEKLVGQLTTEKLAVERKLELAQLALKEANGHLRNSNVKEILGVSLNSSKVSFTDSLKQDFEEAFKGRKF